MMTCGDSHISLDDVTGTLFSRRVVWQPRPAHPAGSNGSVTDERRSQRYREILQPAAGFAPQSEPEVISAAGYRTRPNPSDQSGEHECHSERHFKARR